MFKRLGIFAVLAVCLFAIAIVMVGCGTGNGGDDEEEKKTDIVTLLTETPMEKLVGTYTLVEAERNGEIRRPPAITGKMFLRAPGGISSPSSIHIGTGDIVVLSLQFPFSVDETYFSMGQDQTRYTWDGTHLSFSVSDPTDGSVFTLKWRKE